MCHRQDLSTHVFRAVLLAADLASVHKSELECKVVEGGSFLLSQRVLERDKPGGVVSLLSSLALLLDTPGHGVREGQ